MPTKKKANKPVKGAQNKKPAVKPAGQVIKAAPVKAPAKRVRKPLTPEQRKRKQERDRAYKARKALERAKQVKQVKPVKAVKAPAKKVAAKKPAKQVKKAIGVVKVPVKKPAKRVRKALTAEQRARKNAKARQTYAAKHGKKVSCAGKCCGKRCSNKCAKDISVKSGLPCGTKSLTVTNKSSCPASVTVRPATKQEIEKAFGEIAETVAGAIAEMFGNFVPVVVKAQRQVSVCDRLASIGRELSEIASGRRALEENLHREISELVDSRRQGV